MDLLGLPITNAITAVALAAPPQKNALIFFSFLELLLSSEATNSL